MGTQAAGRYISKDYVVWGSLIELTDIDTVWQALDKRVRTSVRKGERLGVHIRPLDFQSDDLEAMRAITPNDDDIPAQFEPRHHAFIAVDEATQVKLGWILLAGIPGTSKVFLLCHASTKEGKERQTPNLLLWHVIKYFTPGPYRYLDVGGSYRFSLQRYFQGFRQYTYPLVMRPLDIPFRIGLEPFDLAAYGQPLGDPEVGSAWLAETLGTQSFTTLPTPVLARTVCIRELVESGCFADGGELLCIFGAESPLDPETSLESVKALVPCTLSPSDRVKAIYVLRTSAMSESDWSSWQVFAKERRIPLIEDCTYVWGSEGVGAGDFQIYAAGTPFTLPFGAFLVGTQIPHERLWKVHGASDPGKEEEIYAMLAAQSQQLAQIRVYRQLLRARYEENLRSVVTSVTLPIEACPYGFFAKFHTAEQASTVAAFVRRFGVEVGVTTNSTTLIFPCHQGMTIRHVDYISGAIIANFREGCGVPGIRC